MNWPAWAASVTTPIGTAKSVATHRNRLDVSVGDLALLALGALTITQCFEGDGFTFNSMHYEGQSLSFNLEGHHSHVESVSGDRYKQRFRLGSYSTRGPPGTLLGIYVLGGPKDRRGIVRDGP